MRRARRERELALRARLAHARRMRDVRADADLFLAQHAAFGRSLLAWAVVALTCAGIWALGRT